VRAPWEPLPRGCPRQLSLTPATQSQPEGQSKLGLFTAVFEHLQDDVVTQY